MKIALIKKQDSSFWRSCQSITENLLKSYERFGAENNHKLETLCFKSDANTLESFELAKKVMAGSFEVVVWLDHYPHPGAFLKACFGEFQKQKKGSAQNRELPHFVFHLFGDFVLQAPQWQQVQRDMERFQENFKGPLPLSFICASHKQKHLVQSLLKVSDSYQCQVIPFPVEEETFSFREEARLRLRTDLGVTPEDTAIIYTGRLSYQKNVIDLIFGFSHFQKNFNSKAKLFLSGPMDDLGVPYLGKEALDGTFFFHWEEALIEHERLVKEGRIQYLGNFNHNDLSELYSAGDIFSSLSCHNDEDYGMSPAEALCCGLPCVLSDWGGYASFKSYQPNDVHLVSVNPGESRHGPNQAALIKGLIAHDDVFNKENRLKRAQAAQSILGVHAVAESLKTFYSNHHHKNVNFPQFNEKFFKLCALFENNPQAPFRGPSGGYSLFYRELYECYWQPLVEKGGTP